MSMTVILASAGAVALASYVQALSGFGFGLAAIPLLSIVLGPRDAVVIASILSIASSVGVAWKGRAHVDRPAVRLFFLSNLLGMPLGLVAFGAMSESGLRLAIGAATLVSVALLAGGWRLAHRSVPLDIGAGIVSGALGTSVGASGPPVVFAMTARGMASDVQRPTLSTVFACQNVVTVPLLLAFFGGDGATFRYSLGAMLGLAAILLVAVSAGLAAGHGVAGRMSESHFRGLTFGLLIVSATLSLVAGFTG